MAESRDLARRRTPTTQVRQRTRNRDSLLPQRRTTALPDAEINSRVLRPDDDGAFELRRALGMVTDTANSVLAFAREKQLQRDAERGARAVADAQMGTRDEEAYGRFEAYRNAYHQEQARSAAFEYERVLAERAEALATGETIPDLDDFAEVAEQTARELFMDEEGRFKGSFAETPEAAVLLARAMSQVRGRVLAQARETIRDRTNEDFLTRRGTNAYREYAAAAQSWREAARLGRPTPAPGTVQEVDIPASSSPPNETAEDPPRVTPTMFSGWTVGSVPGDPRDGGRRQHQGFDLFPAPGSDGRLIADRPFRVERVRNGPRQGITADVVFEDGTRWTLMHLRERPREGRGQPGDLIAIAGNTGNARTTPAHFHVEGRDASGNRLDPRTHFAMDGRQAGEPTIGLSSRPDFTDQVPEVASGTLPTFSFETLMADLPPGLDRGVAKRTMLAAVLEAAEEAGDWRAMDQLLMSNRADGTPSFNVEEVAAIRDSRERIRDSNRTEADRLRRERYELNGNALIDAIINDGAFPSQAQIQEYRRQDRISPDLAYSLTRTVESEVRQARAEQEQAEREAEFELDVEIESIVAERSAGILNGATVEADESRLRRGELGEGRRALARYRRLRAAAKSAEDAIMRDPESVHYAERIRAEFTPERGGGSRLLRQSSPVNPVPGMLAEYRRRRVAGEAPHVAYEGAVAWRGRTYGNTTDPLTAARQRRDQLRARAAQ